MPASPQDIIRHTKLIRRCFQQLRVLGDRLHADIAINASLRATMEWLSDYGPQTVPQIAAAKSVSRQHVQKTVDELMDRKLVEFVRNPAHKRSMLVQLADRGQQTFLAMQDRELAIALQLAQASDAQQLKASITALEGLSAALTSIASEETEDDRDHP